jgi:hypothetical protein
LLAQACVTPEPAREAVPSNTPARGPARPEPPIPATEGAAAEPARPELRSVPLPAAPAEADGSGADAAREPGHASRRARPPRQAKPKKGSEFELGGSADTAPDNGTLALGQELSQRLSDAVTLASPDCPSARQRKQTICDLAAQICGLSERDPNVASVAEYCEIAQRRCNEAGQRTRQRCDD